MPTASGATAAVIEPVGRLLEGAVLVVVDPQRDIDELVVRRAEVFRDKHGIDLRTGHRAESIDPVSRTVSGFDHRSSPFEVPYDKLLIATGASAIRPDLAGFNLPGVMVLKSLEEGRRIKKFLSGRTTRRVVIVGMGYIALEMAESLRRLELPRRDAGPPFPTPFGHALGWQYSRRGRAPATGRAGCHGYDAVQDRYRRGRPPAGRRLAVPAMDRLLQYPPCP